MFKRIIVLAMAAVLGGLFVAGCSSNDSTPPPEATAKIRVVHTSPNAGPVDVYIGTSVTPWLEDVAYATASTYLSRSTGTITLVIREADADPATDSGIESDPISLAAGASLTVVTAGLVNAQDDQEKFRLITYTDTFQNSPSARARVVHAVYDARNLNVSIGKTGQVLADDLARWDDSGQGGNVYEAGEDRDIVVQATGNQVTSFRAPALEARKDYYFFLIGLISGPGAATTPFDLLIVGPGGALPLENTTLRQFRLVHAAPDGGPVDPYLAFGFGDGFVRTKMADELRYGQATAFADAEVRQVFIEVYMVGADPDLVEPLDSQPAYIHDEAASTTVFSAGLAGSLEPEDRVRLFSLADDFGVHPAGYLSVQVVHACSNLNALAVDFANDGSTEATMERFSGNTEGSFSLLANTAWTMVVRDGATTAVVEVFNTPPMAADTEFYLILTGIKDGMPGFVLLSVNEDGSQGFTAPN